MKYGEFIANKSYASRPSGFIAKDINSNLFSWQQCVTEYLVKLGRGGCYADCGLGKSAIQLEYARQVVRHTNKPVLILCPLAVAGQTKRESEKFEIDVPVQVCKSQADVRDGINITNYERVEKFDPESFIGVIPDESSILKSIDGKTRKLLMERFKDTPYRLCLSATPAPNDHMEIGCQSEFIDVMSRGEMLSMFFVHDGGDTAKWRLKGHARDAFWQWMATWALMIRKPSDIGYEDDGYDLPPLNYEQHIVESPQTPGKLFAADAVTLADERQARRTTLESRCEKAIELAGEDGPCVIWCNLNDEGDALEKMLPGAVQIAGKHSIDEKEERLAAFTKGEIRVLITKPKIGGFGLNWQHCNRTVIFPTHSWEAWYQMIRRFYRFGQTKPVTVHSVISEAEGRVLANVMRKEKESQEMIAGMVGAMSKLTTANVRGTTRMTASYNPSKTMELPKWMDTALTAK